MTINPTQLRWSQGGRWSTRKALHPWYKGLMGLRLAWEGSPACNHWSTGVLYGQLHCRLVEFIPKREFTPKGNRRSRDRASHPRVARVMGLCSRFFKYRALPVENNLTIMLNGVQLRDPSWSESVLITKAWILLRNHRSADPFLSFPSPSERSRGCMSRPNGPILFLSDHRGKYIPQRWLIQKLALVKRASRV